MTPSTPTPGLALQLANPHWLAQYRMRPIWADPLYLQLGLSGYRNLLRPLGFVLIFRILVTESLARGRSLIT